MVLIATKMPGQRIVRAFLYKFNIIIANYLATYITSFTAFITRATFGNEASINVGA